VPPPIPRREVRLSIIGEAEVGKTSLARRYAHGTLDEGHEGPLGEVTSVLQVQSTEGPVEVLLAVFEYPGSRTPAEAADEPAFRNKHGFLAVADLMSRRSLDALKEWVPAVAKATGGAPHRVFLNKSDVVPERAGSFLRWVQANLPGVPGSVGSARTGEGVLEAFDALLLEAVAHVIGQPDDLAVSESGAIILRYAAKRGTTGVTLKELLRIVRGQDFQGIVAEVDVLVHLGLVAREDFGPASFRITITERGESVAQWVAA